MPSIAENVEMWDVTYDWSGAGNEWGDPEKMWKAQIAPHIDGFAWGGTTLEIGPGFGRFTQFLLPRSRHMILVDLSERCLAACYARFGTLDIDYQLNDGITLDAEPDSIDVVFSHSSLVHAEIDVIAGYLKQLATMLKPGRRGLIHHSQLAAMDRVGHYNQWFATSVCDENVADACKRFQLRVLSQTITTHLNDDPIGCITVFERPA